jgi:uncharacterized RDD family membrane protein YckC
MVGRKKAEFVCKCFTPIHDGVSANIHNQGGILMDQPAVTYAGFWKRFVAYIIDDIVLSAAGVLVVLVIGGIFGLGILSTMSGDAEPNLALIAAAASGIIMAVIGIMVAGWLYFALMESSANQGTLGKMALGIKVTDLNGNRISFGKATGRYFGKIVSGMIFYIGFIMAGFTEKKQALHDIMAGCLVVNK